MLSFRGSRLGVIRLLRWMKILVVMTLLISISGCSADEAQYFRRLEIRDGWHLVGVIPMDDQQAKELDCYQFRRDAQGQLVEITFGKGGKLAPDPLLGVARIKIDYEPRVEIRQYYAANGVPIADSTGAYGLKITTNGDPSESEMVVLDKDGRPTKDLAHGADAIRRKFNSKGDIVSESYFNGQGGPMLSRETGVASVAREYDQAGNLVLEAYYDLQGKLTERQDWQFAQMKLGYNEQGQEIETAFYGGDGRLCNSASYGVAVIKKRYDKQGNLIELRFFGTDGQPKADLSGAVVVRMRYDGTHNLLKTSLYDLHNKLIQEY